MQKVKNRFCSFHFSRSFVRSPTEMRARYSNGFAYPKNSLATLDGHDERSATTQEFNPIFIIMQLVGRKFVARTLFAVAGSGSGSGAGNRLHRRPRCRHLRHLRQLLRSNDNVTCAFGVECDGLWRMQWTLNATQTRMKK